MTNDHADTKFSRSPSGIDHYAVNQGVLSGNEDHSVDVVPFTGHSAMEEPLGPKEKVDNSLPATAMVLGLAAACCFVILIVYIVVKVHLCKKQTSKDIKSSTISHDTLKNSPSTVSTVTQNPINSFSKELEADEALPSQQSESENFYRIHSGDFCHQFSEPSLTEEAPQARLTAAKFLPSLFEVVQYNLKEDLKKSIYSEAPVIVYFASNSQHVWPTVYYDVDQNPLYGTDQVQDQVKSKRKA